MENEENRGLFYKKDSEDQLVYFVNAFFGALSLFSLSLSLSLTLGHLEFLGALWHLSKNGKKAGKRRKKARRSRNQAAIAGFLAGIDLHVYFPY